MNIEFECLWKKNESLDRLKAIMLWDQFNTFPSKEVTEQRAKEIVFVAKKGDAVVAVTTVRPRQIKLLNNNWFYELRVFAAPDTEHPMLSVPISLFTKKILERDHVQHHDAFIGIVAVVQNEKMNKQWRRAVWPLIDMYFAGYDVDGHQIRVSYFKNAIVL